MTDSNLDALPLGTNPTNGWHSALRTIVLYIMVAVLGWVGVTISQLTVASNLQNGSIIKLQVQVEALQQNTAAAVVAIPALTTEAATIRVLVNDNTRRIDSLEQVRGLKR